MNNYLIPGIGINNDKLIVFMYDCVNDFLLGTHSLDLFEEGDVYVSVIIVLWLVLNYRLFCSGLIEDFKSYKANFRRLLGDDYLKHYEKEVCMPFHKKYSRRRVFDPTISSLPRNPKRKLESYPEVSLKKVYVETQS